MIEQPQCVFAIVGDPTLATGGAAVAAIKKVKGMRPKPVKFHCLWTCPEGLKTMNQTHPDGHPSTAAVDHQPGDHGYILSGLGDAGAPDRRHPIGLVPAASSGKPIHAHVLFDPLEDLSSDEFGVGHGIELPKRVFR